MMAPSLTYYNDNDARCCAWLRELIADGLLPKGHVDERPIQNVRADDLVGYSQCHFFAGIGGWPYALRLAGIPESENVWTGSCPCQPFSVAGKRKGTADERHVWPEFARLIGECRPATVFGEQVASRDGREWLAGVFADLEAVGYAVAGADLCAAGVGAPHIRQRLYWVAYANFSGDHQRAPGGEQSLCDFHHEADGVSHAKSGFGSEQEGRNGRCLPPGSCEDVRLADGLAQSSIVRWGRWSNGNSSGMCGEIQTSGRGSGSRPYQCQDGKTRRIPIEPALFPLAHGVPGRVGLLRGAGNAIVPQVAAAFIMATATEEGGA